MLKFLLKLIRYVDEKEKKRNALKLMVKEAILRTKDKS